MKKSQFSIVAGVWGALVVAALTARSQTLTFGAANVSTGSGPAMVIPVDINGNGHPGLVCANFGFSYSANFNIGNGSGHTLSVFTNDGSGNLTPSATLNVGNAPVSLATADVNDDGFADIICGNVGDGTLSVLTNTGKGSFVLAGTYTVGTDPISVAAADVNGDGHVDLICANYSDASLTVLTNNGHGVFTKSATITTGTHPDRVVAEDFNGDGNLDLVSADSGSSTLSVFTNNGRGVFTRSARVSVSGGVGWVIAVAANRDGKVDLANLSGGLISIFTNGGNANFTLASTVVATNAGVMVAGDMNGDGKADLVCNANNNGIQGSAMVFTNNGHGIFSFCSSTPVGSPYWASIGGNYPNFVTVADFNGDGNLDIAASCFGTALVTELVEEEFSPVPIVKITSPVSDSVLPASDAFLLKISASSSFPIEVVFYYYDGTNILGVSETAPFTITNIPGRLVAGSHGLQAVAIDGDGNIGYSREIQVNITGSVKTLPNPKVTVTNPGGGASISTNANFVMKATASAPSGAFIDLVNFYYDSTSNLLASLPSPPYQCTVFAGTIPAGSHKLFAIALDTVGGVGESALVPITFKAGVATPPALTVAITSPTNEQPFSTTNTVTVKSSIRSTGSLASLFLSLLIDGTNELGLADPPYSFVLPPGSFTAGAHTLQEIANGINGFGTSAVVHITINAPGTSLINFDALNTTAGAVSGTTLARYLSAFGVTLSNVTVGTTLEAVNQSNFTGSVQAFPSSAPNLFTQAGVSGPVNFTLVFAHPLQALTFTRAALSASSGLLSHPAWTATAYDTDGTELSAVSEGLILTTASAVPERIFTLQGNGITSVTFASDSQNVAAFSGVLLDDLFLNQNPVIPVLSVSLAVASPPTNDIIAPATINLTAAVNDSITSSYSVSFFAGLNFLGTVSQPPYQFAWTNVLPGHYDLRASVLDATGLSARSASVPIVVQLEPDSTLVNFENLPTKTGPLQGAPVRAYLARFGMGVSSISSGTALAVERQRLIAGGKALNASSGSNVLTQVGINGPVQFTLSFTNQLLRQFGFTRPELLANPFVSFPAWQATAFDSAGAIVDQVKREELDRSADVGAERFSLSGQPNGPGIARVEFASEGSGLTTFNAIVLDDLVLTTNPAPFAPSVAITKPVSGRSLAAPPLVTIVAEASDSPTGVDGAGIATVSFYETPIIIGANSFTFLLSNVTTAPYKVNWAPAPRLATYSFTAVAQSQSGLMWTSQPVIVRITQPATQFGILSPPANQVAPVGGSAVFTVVPSGTNGVTYQWTFFNGNTTVALSDNAHISGSDSPTLALNPPLTAADAGTYSVGVFSAGVLLTQSAVLTVIDAPVINPQPLGQTVPPGTTVTLSPNATGGVVPLSWQWLLNGATIPGATNRVYSILAAQPLQSGNYQVVVASQGASTVSAVAPVIVLTPTSLPFTNDNFSNRIAIDPLLGPVADSNALATTEIGEPPPLPGYVPSKSIWFTWKPDFTGTVSLTTQGSDFDTVLAIYTGTTLRSLKLMAADDDSGGFHTSLVTFNVVAGNSYQIAVDGFQGAAGRVVLGFPAGNGYRILNPSSGDSVPVIIRQPVSRVVAANATVVLSVGAVSATRPTYQWSFQNAPITGATASSLTIRQFQPASVGMYSVLVANETGSVQSQPANLQIANDQGATPTLTENKLLTGNNSSSPTKAAYNLTPLAVGGDTRGFTVSQVFSTVGSTSEPGEPQPCGQVPNASQWFVYQTQTSGTFEVDTVGSSYNTLLGVYTGNGSSFAGLNEVGCGYSTNFETEGQPSVTIPGVPKGETFYIVIDGYQGATGLAQLHIGLGTPLTLSNNPASLLATAGSNVIFKVAVASGSIPGAYQWQLNGADLPGGTKSTYTVTNAQNDAVGNYSVIVSNAVGVVTSSPPTALTLQYQPLIVSGPTNKTVLLGQLARFSVTTLGVNVRTNPFFNQWYSVKTGLIPKATALTLTIPVTHWTNNDSYYLVISNSYGVVTSTPALLTVTDPTPPTVAIRAPRNNFTSATNPITISGVASDRVGVSEVVVEMGNGPFLRATGSNAWSYSATLLPGPNTISVRSVNVAGNASASAILNLIYKPATAAPVDDKKTMASPDNPLADAVGTYNGLFYPASGATEASSGFFTATVTGPGGAFSANLLLDGGSYPFAGQFDSSGNARVLVPRAGQTSLAVSLHLNLAPPDDHLNGVIGGASWLSLLQAARESSPAPGLGGQFVLVLPPDAATAGQLAVTNSSGGMAQITGVLADGATLFRIAPVSKDLGIPLYAPLYSGQGLFLGWITLTNASTTFGQAAWIKPGATNATSVWIVK